MQKVENIFLCFRPYSIFMKPNCCCHCCCELLLISYMCHHNEFLHSHSSSQRSKTIATIHGVKNTFVLENCQLFWKNLEDWHWIILAIYSYFSFCSSKCDVILDSLSLFIYTNSLHTIKCNDVNIFQGNNEIFMKHFLWNFSYSYFQLQNT